MIQTKTLAALAAAALALAAPPAAQAADFTPDQMALLRFINGKHFWCELDNNGIGSIFEFGTWVEPDLTISGEQSENFKVDTETYYYENNVRGFAYSDESGFGIYLNSLQARRIDSLPSPYGWSAPVAIRLTLEGVGTGVKVGGSVTFEGSRTLPFRECGAWGG